MDVASIAAALVGARMAQMQLALAAKLAKIQANSDAAVVKLVSAADQNLEQLTGLGSNVDISV